jgi:hypothetical protein
MAYRSGWSISRCVGENPDDHRRRVDERLERAARLPLRLRRPVELRVVVVAAAHQRQDVARPRIHDHDGALEVRRGIHGLPADVSACTLA